MPLRRFFYVALIAFSSLIAPPASWAARPPASTAPANSSDTRFASESAAQAHCPKDTVVWLNTNSGIYHEKGRRWYGRTKHGAYVCRHDADGDGARGARNGQ
jgi:hypothetical protein